MDSFPGATMSGKQLAQLDMKFDNGNPASGDIIAVAGGDLSKANFELYCSTSNQYMSSGVTTSTGIKYKNSDIIACIPSFRIAINQD